MIDIVSALKDPNLYGQVFPRLETWWSWIVLLKSISNVEMDSSEYDLYRRCTQRKTFPKNLKELYVICGRRSGKSRIASLLASYLSSFQDNGQFLAPGEKATALVVAVDRYQTRTTFGYTAGIFDSVPMLGSLVTNRTAETLELKNRVSIEIHSASFRGLRGYTILVFIADEVAFWRSEESQNPDTEIFHAVRGGMGTLPNSLIIALSSPYARRGVLWQNYSKYFGKEDDRILVWVADTKTMNPSLDQSVIDAAYEEDPVVAASEYGALFRSDIEDFINLEAITACIANGRRELPPISGVRYFGFVDPSGGSSDSMTLGISHAEGKRVVLDCIREKKPPFSPESTVGEFCETLKSYHVSKVIGDRYGGEWPREQFRKHGISYEPSEKTKSDLYLSFLPLINSGTVELLDDKKMIGQFMNLERRSGRGGKDSIDHGPGAHDDVANSVAGACVLVSIKQASPGLFVISKSSSKSTGEHEKEAEDGQIVAHSDHALKEENGIRGGEARRRAMDRWIRGD